MQGQALVTRVTLQSVYLCTSDVHNRVRKEATSRHAWMRNNSLVAQAQQASRQLEQYPAVRLRTSCSNCLESCCLQPQHIALDSDTQPGDTHQNRWLLKQRCPVLQGKNTVLQAPMTMQRSALTGTQVMSHKGRQLVLCWSLHLM